MLTFLLLFVQFFCWETKGNIPYFQQWDIITPQKMPFGVRVQFMGLSTTNKFVLFGGYNSTIPYYKDIVLEYDPKLNVYVI